MLVTKLFVSACIVAKNEKVRTRINNVARTVDYFHLPGEWFS